MAFRTVLKSLPIIGPLANAARRALGRGRFDHSTEYWERRYTRGGNSGAGSYNRLAAFKAAILNEFVARNAIHSVIEFGSGDGAQLELATYPDYVGVDVSRTAVDTTRQRFRDDPSKIFYHSSEFPPGRTAELTLSLDVIYHLVEDDVFEAYMRSLFEASSRHVIIYSSNEDADAVRHVRHRRFTRWIEDNKPDFVLTERVPNAYPFDKDDPDNSSLADFYFFERARPA
jgi:hypothetical protein